MSGPPGELLFCSYFADASQDPPRAPPRTIFVYFWCLWGSHEGPLGEPFGTLGDVAFFVEITGTLRQRVGGLAGSPGEGFREG